MVPCRRLNWVPEIFLSYRIIFELCDFVEFSCFVTTRCWFCHCLLVLIGCLSEMSLSSVVIYHLRIIVKLFIVIHCSTSKQQGPVQSHVMNDWHACPRSYWVDFYICYTDEAILLPHHHNLSWLGTGTGICWIAYPVANKAMLLYQL